MCMGGLVQCIVRRDYGVKDGVIIIQRLINVFKGIRVLRLCLKVGRNLIDGYGWCLTWLNRMKGL